VLQSRSPPVVLLGPCGEGRQFLEARDDFLVDGIRWPGPIHGEHPFPARVVLQQRHCLFQVHLQAVLDDGFGIV
jgi:hypothetical protein